MTHVQTPARPRALQSRNSKSTVGVILACQHYPVVSRVVSALDSQLRKWLEACGVRVDDIVVYDAFDGEIPNDAARCDAWIVSGAVLPLNGPSHDQKGAMLNFLRVASALGRPVFALNHAEHLVHQALAAIDAPPPATSPDMRSIRNPLRSFQGRDTLHRFDRATRRVVQLTRPATLAPRTLFGALRAVS